MKRAGAEALLNELRRRGVDDSQIIYVARADAEPIFYESMPAGEAGNRRVEVYLEY